MFYRFHFSTPKGHAMFFDYLEKLRMSGRVHFTYQEIIDELSIS